MIELVKEIEIREVGEYHAKVVVDGQECSFHVNSQTLADADCNDLVAVVAEIMVALRAQENVVFYERDGTGHRRYVNLQGRTHKIWQALLYDDVAYAFFFRWHFV